MRMFFFSSLHFDRISSVHEPFGGATLDDRVVQFPIKKFFKNALESARCTLSVFPLPEVSATPRCQNNHVFVCKFVHSSAARLQPYITQHRHLR
jgi:hypothetical protein